MTLYQTHVHLEPDATLSFVNRAAREYLGRIDAITPTERLGAIIHPEDLEALLEHTGMP